jgi:hypothetical protein
MSRTTPKATISVSVLDGPVPRGGIGEAACIGDTSPKKINFLKIYENYIGIYIHNEQKNEMSG